ncbi:MAG: putative 2-aminoethylphosphonate ABC transporter substrate-binding protein [Caldilineaceae bacterium]
MRQVLALWSVVVALFAAMLVAGCAAVTPAPGAAPASSSAAAATSTGEATMEAATAAAAGDTSGEITVYTALEDDQIAEYLPMFNAKYPSIKVNVVRDSTGIVTAKLLAEKANPVADVVWGLAATSLLNADQQGMLEPYAPAGLDRIDASFRDPNNPPHWVGIDTWFSAFCANTEELKAKGLPVPTSWADLIKPEYKGMIAMPNPASSGTGYLSVSAILQLMGEEKGWQYLDALHDNIAVYTHSGSKPCKMAGAGEVPIGVSFDYRAVKQKADGEPIQPVFPSEGSGWEMEANALIKKTDIKPAAKAFLDWAIGDEIMAKYAENYPITAAKTDVPVPAGYPADVKAQLIKNDLVQAAAKRDAILAEWTKRYDAKSEPK